MVNVKTLADFKRFLAQPGATVQVVRNDWMDAEKTPHPVVPKAGYFEPKQVSRLKSNGVYFTTGWLAFPKAAHVRFDGDTATFCMNQDGTFRQVFVYRLSLTPAAPVTQEQTKE